MRKRGATSSYIKPTQALPRPQTVPGSDLMSCRSQHHPKKSAIRFRTHSQATRTQRQGSVGPHDIFTFGTPQPFFWAVQQKAGKCRARAQALVSNLQTQSHEGLNKILLEVNPKVLLRFHSTVTRALGAQCSYSET